MGGPPKDCGDFAWPSDGLPAQNGKFLCRVGGRAKTSEIKIREEAITDPKLNRRHEAPLCGGHCVFYKAPKPDVETGKPLFLASLNLALNLQRFVRHQPQSDDQPKLGPYRLQRRRETRRFHRDEQALDGSDNWLPNSPEWLKISGKNLLPDYLSIITKEFEKDVRRACEYANAGELDPVASFRRPTPTCALSRVETFWEFPSDDPIGAILNIGAKVMHLVQGNPSTKAYPLQVKESGRVQNAPSFTIPLAQGVSLRLYAKTNKRIRFEIVQFGLRKELKDLREEALRLTDPWEEAEKGGHWAQNMHCSPSELPTILQALRNRAARHINKVMEELRKGRTRPVVARSVVDLLAHVAFAVRAGLKSRSTQRNEMKALLYMLCYQRGFRGTRKEGPMAEALQALEAAGVLKFDRSRLFYALMPPYTKAADALVSATGEPLLSIFGLTWTECKATKAAPPRTRLRE